MNQQADQPMRVLKPTGKPDCDEVLNWVDAHAASASLGLPAQVLNTRWANAGREPGALADVLRQLFENDWLMLTPDLHPPHMLLKVEGFRRLVNAPPPLGADDPAPAARPHGLDPQIPRPGSAPTQDAPPAAEQYPNEISLRNDILDLYRNLDPAAENRLTATALARAWQDAGNRTADLRGGIDVLIRDGYLAPRTIGDERFWQLTHEGLLFIRSPRTPLRLLRLSPPLDTIDEVPAPAELGRLVARQLEAMHLQAGDEIDYAWLRPEWMQSTRLDDNALLHGLDLMFKHGFVTIGDEPDAPMILTRDGLENGAKGEIARLLGKLKDALI